MKAGIATGLTLILGVALGVILSGQGRFGIGRAAAGRHRQTSAEGVPPGWMTRPGNRRSRSMFT